MPDASPRDLNLWKKHLGRVPDWVWACSQAETLVLADNGLTGLPGDVGRMQSLRMLDLGHNQLAELPEELGALTGLRDFLYLHDNRLGALPGSLARLTRLRYLNISENRFQELPECVCGMAGLIADGAAFLVAFAGHARARGLRVTAVVRADDVLAVRCDQRAGVGCRAPNPVEPYR